MSEETLLKLIDYANLQNKLIESNCEKIILQQENLQLKQKLSILSVKPAIPTTEEKLKYRIEKAIEYTKKLREKYFRDGVWGSNNDLSELIEILKED